MDLVLHDAFEHSSVRILRGARSGVVFIVAIHTPGAQGIALGGCRMVPYASVDDALMDALRLSRAMTFKSAAAGLRHGGAKCVVASPPPGRFPARLRREVLLDVGEAVEELGGSFVTGEDAGVTIRDVSSLAERTRHVVGLPRARGGAGDPSVLTAYGVTVAIAAACEQVYGEASLQGRSMAILGLGNVGARVAKRVAGRGARLVVADLDERKRALAERLGAEWTSPDELLVRPVDILVPCALGGVLTRQVVEALGCRVIVGAANNQLTSDAIADDLMRRGILWAPDFIVNAGGLISVASEVDGYDGREARRRTRAIADTLRDVFAAAQRDGVSTMAAGMRLVNERIASAVRVPSSSTGRPA